MQNEDVTLPAAILGVEDKQNLFIDEAGEWKADYIPAYVRRYPFIFATGDDGKTLTVCLDEGFVGCNGDGQGEPLFAEDGEQSPGLQRMVAFLAEYQNQYQRTRAFCDRVRELDLLEPMQANVALNSGEQISLAGFMVVNRAKLKELDAEKLKEMAQTDDLELLYIHLFSMNKFPELVDRLAAKKADD